MSSRRLQLHASIHRLEKPSNICMKIKKALREASNDDTGGLHVLSNLSNSLCFNYGLTGANHSRAFETFECFYLVSHFFCTL